MHPLYLCVQKVWKGTQQTDNYDDLGASPGLGTTGKGFGSLTEIQVHPFPSGVLLD